MVGQGGRSLVLVGVALVWMALPLAAQAGDPSPAEEARALHERATAAFALGNYASAAEWFEKAFERKPDPAELYNAAQARRLAGNRERALLLYRNYLRVFPRAGRRAEVETRVQELTHSLEQDKQPAPAAPSAPAPPPPAATPIAAPPAAQPAPLAEPAPPAPARIEPAREAPAAPTPAPAAASAVATPPLAPPPVAPPPTVAPPSAPPALLVSTSAAPASDAPPPLTHRAWFWIAIGVGVAGAAAAAMIVARGGDKRPSPSLGIFQ